MPQGLLTIVDRAAYATAAEANEAARARYGPGTYRVVEAESPIQALEQVVGRRLPPS